MKPFILFRILTKLQMQRVIHFILQVFTKQRLSMLEIINIRRMFENHNQTQYKRINAVMKYEIKTFLAPGMEEPKNLKHKYENFNVQRRREELTETGK